MVKASDAKRTQSPGKTSPPAACMYLVVEKWKAGTEELQKRSQTGQEKKMRKRTNQ
jgi:hypothetical protein